MKQRILLVQPIPLLIEEMLSSQVDYGIEVVAHLSYKNLLLNLGSTAAATLQDVSVAEWARREALGRDAPPNGPQPSLRKSPRIRGGDQPILRFNAAPLQGKLARRRPTAAAQTSPRAGDFGAVDWREHARHVDGIFPVVLDLAKSSSDSRRHAVELQHEFRSE